MSEAGNDCNSASGGAGRPLSLDDRAAFLFAATAINYIDRQMIGLLKPTHDGRSRA